MPAHRRAPAFQHAVVRIQRREQPVGGLQRVHARLRIGGVRSQAVQRHFHLQAAVVGGDHLVAEAGRDQQVGLGEALVQQPARTEFTAKLLVVGEVQLDTTLERRAQRLQRAHAKVKLAKSLLLTADARP
jgi:hypothetical protein